MRRENDVDGQNSCESRQPPCLDAKSSAGRAWVSKAGALSAICALPTFLGPQTVKASGEDAGSANLDRVGGTGARYRPDRPGGPIPDFLRRRDGILLRQRGKLDIVSEFGGTDDCPGTSIEGMFTGAAPYTAGGDTTGANDTLSTLQGYYGIYNVGGPDHIYTFSIVSTGTSPEIRVTPSSPTHDPAIYILDSRYYPCSDVRPFPSVYINNAGPGHAESFSGDGLRQILPLNTPLYLYIDSSTPGNAGPYTLRMQDVTVLPGHRTKFDFDRDGKAEISVFRPSDSTWYMDRGSQGVSARQFGISTDRITPADYDGDGRTDIGVFREGTWYWINSSDGTLGGFQFGVAGDIPQPADFDGDARSELAVFRGGTWYTHNLRTNQFSAIGFGLPGDRPVVGDYDRDGRADHAVYRNGTWFLRRSHLGFIAVPFGLPADVVVPADYNGDSQTDLAVFRDGAWHVQTIFNSQLSDRFQFSFGSPGDIPVPGDYRGSGRAQPAVVRGGTWYIAYNTHGPVGFTTHPFGRSGDKPVPAAYLP